LVNNPQKITLRDLQDESKFPRMSTIVTLQCSGTRRIEQIHEYPGDGDELINAPWGEGAIGTARWTGVSLKKVIKYCGGLKEGGKHLEFFGADTYFKKGQVYNYAVAVPAYKMKANEVMLAWEMNGKPLPKIHGAPLRVVVFGYMVSCYYVHWNIFCNLCIIYYSAIAHYADYVVVRNPIFSIPRHLKYTVLLIHLLLVTVEPGAANGCIRSKSSRARAQHPSK